MIKSLNKSKNQVLRKKRSLANRYKKLVSIGEISKDIISDMSSPIDATNRFINLALHSIGENPQGRQFLIESKEGIRKTSVLLQKLNQCARKLEEEVRGMVESQE
jgi:hypothetical protein